MLRRPMVRLTRELEVDGRELLVFDNFLPKADHRELAQSLGALPWSRCQVDSKSSRRHYPDYRYFAATIDTKGVQSKQIFLEMASLVAEHFPGERLRLDRAYVNQNVFGDITFIHSDSARHGDVSAVYFAHDKWNADWGGETMFFDRASDARHAVSATPNRLLLFRGSIKHKIGVPTRQCTRARLTMAFKLVVARR